ncbi:MAG TPA: hypothetical protein VNA57_07570 [Acidimicrobiales bacterium]|nr:hypothetical protein [Acidimicrobiales bacterium]
MERSARKIALAGALATVLGISVMGVAFACSASSRISARPGSGVPGSSIKLTGSNFNDDEIAIQWNSTTAPTLLKVNGPSFSVNVTVPANASPGVYYIVATTDGFRARTSFTVTSPGDAVIESSESAPAEVTSNSASAGEEPENTTSPQPTTAKSSGPATSTNTATAPSSGRGGIPEAPSATSAPEATTASGASPAGAAVPTTPGAAQRQATSTIDRAQVTSSAQATSSPLATTGGAPDERPALSPKAATADLWSGFATTASGAVRGAGLADAAPASSGPSPALGIGLFAGGLVAMFAGFGAAEATRRKALATTR